MHTIPPFDNQEQPDQNENNSLLASIIQSSDDAIIGKDLNGIITSWNPAAEKIFGYAAQEVIGHSINSLLPPERLREEADILKKIIKGMRVDHFETERVCKDGRRIDMSVSISPILNGNGKVIGASKIARDITLQKQAQLLLTSNKELAFQIEEKSKREAELAAISQKLKDSLWFIETFGIAIWRVA